MILTPPGPYLKKKRSHLSTHNQGRSLVIYNSYHSELLVLLLLLSNDDQDEPHCCSVVVQSLGHCCCCCCCWLLVVAAVVVAEAVVVADVDCCFPEFPEALPRLGHRPVVVVVIAVAPAPPPAEEAAYSSARFPFPKLRDSCPSELHPFREVDGWKGSRAWRPDGGSGQTDLCPDSPLAHSGKG